ncbi:MAG: hypothetical protein ABI423_09665 [Burkholderiales bacterium]
MDGKVIPDAVLLNPACRGQDWADYEQSKSNFGSLLVTPDYDLIERASQELGFSREKFATGEYLFEALYTTLSTSLDFDGAHGARFVEQWLSAKGSAGYAYLGKALVQYHGAWKARGTGFANTVTPEAWDAFYKGLAEANATLDSSSAMLKQMGPWHALKLAIVFAHPKLESERPKALQAASLAWPDYLTVYSIPMERMHPRWGGSYELMEGVARFALDRTKAEHGASIYALLYERQFREDCDCTLADSKADWTLMKQGFRDADKRRALQPLRTKRFAALACQVRDRDEARRLYEIYDKVRDRSAGEEPDACRIFASK